MNRLKLLREEKKLSQEYVGNLIGISGQALGLYENGKRDIPTKNLTKLAEFFNVSIDYLLGKSDIRNNNSDKLDDNDLYFKLSQEDKGYISTELKNSIKNYINFVIEEEKKKKDK